MTDEPALDPVAIAIVGNLNLDIKTAPLPASPAILRDGETSAPEIYETIGGGAANTAAAAAALGGRVHFCAAIGRDALGARLVGHLQSLGIVTHMAATPAATGRTMVLTWDHHQRHFVSCLPSAAALTAADVDVAALAAAGCRHLYRADVWFAPHLLDGGNLELLSQARAAGMETSLDINFDPLWSRPDRSAQWPPRCAALSACLPHVTYVHGNEPELMRFTRTSTIEEAVAALLDAGAQRIILHRGPRGSAAADRLGWVEAAPMAVSQIVTETGTGDVFTAAFLLLGRLPLPERLAACNRIAARHLAGTACYIPRLAL